MFGLLLLLKLGLMFRYPVFEFVLRFCVFALKIFPLVFTVLVLKLVPRLLFVKEPIDIEDAAVSAEFLSVLIRKLG